jgi:hypothetical protein
VIITSKIKAKMEQWGAQWLNPMGRLVLIKAMLSAFPIYQFSSLLAPASIKSSLAQSIRKFLWEGGKTNRKRYHLVKWQVVREPKELGDWE